jgi:Zn-dependent protease
VISREGSFYLGHLGPIPLFIHWSFAFLVWMVVSSTMGQGASTEIIISILAVLLVGIVLHELGHGLAAKATGGNALSITLWAFGGVCHTTGTRYPRHELIIVLAGPLVSAILAAACYLVLEGVRETHREWLFEVIDGYRRPTLLHIILNYGYSINLLLLIFNMMPIYPLDGGQAVHNVMLMFLRRNLANRIAMAIAIIGAIAYVAWRAHGSGQVDPYLVLLMGYLLFNAWTYLR